MNDNQDHLNLLRKINSKPGHSQRKLADDLKFSLGKLNYCLKALTATGLVKIENFRKNPKKISYLYILTPKGISAKTDLTIRFMKRKMKEYDELKSEIESKIKKIEEKEEAEEENGNKNLSAELKKMKKGIEQFLEKSTEIGISEVTPIVCDRTEKKYINDKRLRKVLISAMKQSLKSHLPKLNPIISLKEFIKYDFKDDLFIAH